MNLAGSQGITIQQTSSSTTIGLGNVLQVQRLRANPNTLLQLTNPDGSVTALQVAAAGFCTIVLGAATSITGVPLITATNTALTIECPLAVTGALLPEHSDS